MSVFFVDSSALAKRYVIETGSAWVRSWILPSTGNIIVISALTTVEVVSLLMRREREGTISVRDRVAVQNTFLRHVEDVYLTVEIDDVVLMYARNLLTRHVLRTLDAVQLACALAAVRTLGVKMTFVSADRRLLAAASAEGLAVDDPNAHD